jgi:Ca2+/Na+ antiporter
MKMNWLFGIGIAVSAGAAIYFILKVNLNLAVLSMIALFSLTNAARAVSFKNQGMLRESKWMKWLSMFFVIAFIVYLFIIQTI